MADGNMRPGSGTAATARACFEAYAESDRARIEAILAPDFRFTSPRDNALDRDTYFDICWPGHEQLDHYDFIEVVPSGDKVFVVYECRTRSGKIFRNCEMMTIRDGKVLAVDVYFGWNVPHDVPRGQHDPSR